MTNHLILTKLDEDADRILDAFEDQSGLEGDDEGDRRRFDIAGRQHEIDIVQMLTDIDENWTDHVGVADPE